MAWILCKCLDRQTLGLLMTTRFSTLGRISLNLGCLHLGGMTRSSRITARLAFLLCYGGSAVVLELMLDGVDRVPPHVSASSDDAYILHRGV